MIDLTQFNPIFATELFGNTLNDYTLFLGLVILILSGLKVFELIVLVQLKRFAKKTKMKLDDMLIEMLDSFSWPFYFFLALYLSSTLIEIHDLLKKGINAIVILSLGYYAIKSVNTIITFFTEKEIKKRKRKDKKHDVSFLKVISKIIKGVVWVIGIMFILQNLGIEITPLIASVGIGGIAIAFALQNILSDLFSSFSIYFDKPFETGDFIIIGTDMGTVEHIGIKTTRIKTLKGQELIVSNTELTSTRVNNYKRMKKRRIVFPIGVIYETPSKKVEKIPKIIEDIIKKTDGLTFDRAHFKAFGDFALIYEVVYYVNSKDYSKYMDSQQKINFAIKKAFEKEKIEFAYPTQKVYVSK
ncbi:mechanosensitive ion channel family protein [Candidatus Woesearchaeota archaeon]|nr:mechanosensitive ion channel family protein [Candidatus Woesearchaeota archaeon]